eukprot:3501028-Rhodomonas_salina.2
MECAALTHRIVHPVCAPIPRRRAMEASGPGPGPLPDSYEILTSLCWCHSQTGTDGASCYQKSKRKIFESIMASTLKNFLSFVLIVYHTLCLKCAISGIDLAYGGTSPSQPSAVPDSQTASYTTPSTLKWSAGTQSAMRGTKYAVLITRFGLRQEGKSHRHGSVRSAIYPGTARYLASRALRGARY